MTVTFCRKYCPVINIVADAKLAEHASHSLYTHSYRNKVTE